MPPRHDASLRSASAVIGPPLTMRELLARCGSCTGLEEYSPLHARSYLVLDMTGAEDFCDADVAALVDRLRQLPVPVLAIGASVAPLLARGIDVLLPGTEATGTLVKNINGHPLAAMTLVQLLRHNEDVTPLQALFAESLAYASLQGGADFTQALATIPAAEHFAQGDAVLVSREGDELHIALNRPQQHNAYNTAMRDGLYEALQLLHSDASLRRAVIRGEGRCFCSGGDLSEFGSAKDTSLAHAIRSTRSVGQLLLELAPRVEFRLHRACVGAGIELPAFAAHVVANQNTFIQLPEITLGLIPGAGGTVSIPRRIGRHRTAYLALSARRINARTALQWGLVDALA
jgi:enoyl-CoA hydratase